MQPGTVLRDKYQLVATIGRGGMGEVFHAVHTPSGTDVALKVVNREIVDEMMMARLEREAAAATRIQSPYIPRVLDVDRLDTGELFLVMELLHGESLSERLKKGGILTWEEVFNIGDNVLRALIDAHQAGVVHRDLKPGNIFIEHLDGGLARARILDFGVCKLDEQDTKKLTITGESVGTIAYMAPEQIRGASKVDDRADLYSFAMIVYEALCGRLPYDAQGQMALLATKLERPAKPLKGNNMVPVPPALDALLTRALSRKPGDRPANAREMLKAWQALGSPTVPAAPPSNPTIPGGGPLAPSSPPTQVAVTAGVRSTMSGRKGRSIVAAGLTVGIVLAVGVVTAMSRKGPAAPSDEAIVPAAEAPRPGATEAVAAPPPPSPPPAPVLVESAAPPAAPVAPPASTVAASRPDGAPVVELDEAARPMPAPRAHASSVSTGPAPKAKTPIASAKPPAVSTPAAPPAPPSTSKGKGPTIVEQPRY